MDDYLEALDRELREILVSPGPVYDPYYGMFRYHLGWTDAEFNDIKSDTGKRLRALLCLLCCDAVSGDWRSALPIAAAVELAHNFSLIHDDIEDESDSRRGRPAVWKVWGLAQGLNAGDGMFVLAHLAVDRLCDRGFSPEKCAVVSRVFDQAMLALCRGQFLDLEFESRLDVTVVEYLEMIRGKTAALMSAATRLGAMLKSDDEHVVDALARFGENIGLSFQIADDILGIWGDPSVTGKSAATDILSRKKSLPAIFGLTHPKHGRALRDLYGKDRLTAEDVRTVLALLEASGARAYAQSQADAFRAAAHAALEETGITNRAMAGLSQIADLMSNRVR